MAKQRSKKQTGKSVLQSNGSAAISLNNAAEVEAAEKTAGPVITIKFKYLAIVAYLYMVVPILIFFVSWLRWYVGFPMAIILSYGLYYLLKNNYIQNKETISFSRMTIIICAIILFAFLFFTGQGGFFFQYSDNHTRNAIFRDLVNFQWPVIYPKTGNALVYYLMHWIVPALFGKVFNHSFLIARIALLIWTYVGLILAILLICFFLKIKTSKQIGIVIAIFIAWGGVNIIGGIISNVFDLTTFSLNQYGWWTNFSINGQGYGFMFRSNCDQLASVYNQTIVPWIAIQLMLKNPKISTFAFLGLCVFPYAPLPFVGLVIIMMVYAFMYCRKQVKVRAYLQIIKEVFSIPNLSAVLSIFIVFVLYFRSNNTANTLALYIPFNKFNFISMAILLLFYILQFGLFVLFIKNDHRRDPLYLTICISMIIIPLIKLGPMGDFCWNVSVPAYYILMILVMKYIFSNTNTVLHNKNQHKVLVVNYNVIALIICLTFSALNSISQIGFGFKIAYEEKTFNLMCDNTKTLSDKNIGDYCPDTILNNYLVPNPESKAFYKYLARK